MNNAAFTTPREIRQILFQVPGADARETRIALFELGHEAQDQPAPANLKARATSAIRAYESL